VLTPLQRSPPDARQVSALEQEQPAPKPRFSLHQAHNVAVPQHVLFPTFIPLLMRKNWTITTAAEAAFTLGTWPQFENCAEPCQTGINYRSGASVSFRNSQYAGPFVNASHA
jgi:hypothetical protein